MKHISYSQNFEDVILFRALGKIENGFYIDIGANDPEDDSVTKVFYDQGWSGINIEPVTEYFEKLTEQRRRDINLELAIGDGVGEINVFDVNNTRGWSTSSKEIADQYRESGLNVNSKLVQQTTLAEICKKYVGDKQIHFLKIDVEGDELRVLKGMDFIKWRPWVLLVEVTNPLNKLENPEITNLLSAHNYISVYFDGINRFYLANEHIELKDFFYNPPNVLDDFVRNSEYVANSRMHQMENRFQTLENESLHLKAELASIYRSRSWKITKPLRDSKILARKISSFLSLKKTSFYYYFLNLLRKILRNSITIVRSIPFLEAVLRSLLSHFPLLFSNLKSFTGKQKNRPTLPLRSRVKISDVKSGEDSPARFSSSGKFEFDYAFQKRIFYCFVDHTISCAINSGVQRVVRQICKGLVDDKYHVKFVKWDSHYKKLVYLDRNELQELAKWNGPRLSDSAFDQYPLPKTVIVPIEEISGSDNWLIVPEVTHITSNDEPLTLDVIMHAKSLGLKTAFVFYDATPFRREELKGMSVKHETYMQHLQLADLILPISKWAERDLIEFIRCHEHSKLLQGPQILTIPLPGSNFSENRTIGASELESKTILSVGSIMTHKNQFNLIAAFNSHCKEFPDSGWELILVGNIDDGLKADIQKATKDNKRIKCLVNVSDEKLAGFYRSCSFTVFPSVMEGYGLPILESIWYGKPVVCANFGAMVEVAEGGGCLTCNTLDSKELLDAINELIFNNSLRENLKYEAENRQLSTWSDYCSSLVSKIDLISNPLSQLYKVYYWVDHTAKYPANTGIQRVVRGLAKAMQELNIQLIPVKWDNKNNCLCSPTSEELKHLESWNGPSQSKWSSWLNPSHSSARDWVLIPELVSDPDGPNGENLKKIFSQFGLRCAWLFYDAIPWKMTDIYPPHVSNNHGKYMLGLNEFELVFPISDFSRIDLLTFLINTDVKTPRLEERIITCALPGEFLESERELNLKINSSSQIKILSVGTVEPRKNHLSLLEAFQDLVKKTDKDVELIIAGGGPFEDLNSKVQNYIQNNPRITWEKSVSDTRLRELYSMCDFTVYPSLEEGFGLPILESLWHGRPSVCRNTGAMLEVARDGGCLTVETADPKELADAILKLVDNFELRQTLSRQALNRKFKTWNNYAYEIATRMATERFIPLEVSNNELTQTNFYNQFVNLNPRPLLSICITTYNRAKWLEVSLKNLARLIPVPDAQIELVVCDNTSPDHTPEVVKPYLGRSDFRYYRNAENVGMLGNLRVTAQHARGQFIWVLGDDDLVCDGAIEKIISVIKKNPDLALIYLNYSYTREDDASSVKDITSFLKNSTPITAPVRDVIGKVSDISTCSENFFTAIYCLVYRRDHALRAYSQNTSGRPFSTMLTCIPTTYYVLNYMMSEPAYWIGQPLLVVNLNVSWMKYASIWILERLPEAHDLAEKMGADPKKIDDLKKRHLAHVLHWYREIFENDQDKNIDYFSPTRLMYRIKHLKEFKKNVSVLKAVYQKAYISGHPAAKVLPKEMFQCVE